MNQTITFEKGEPAAVFARKDQPFVILQLTDMQVIDAGQCRTPDRLNEKELAILGIAHAGE